MTRRRSRRTLGGAVAVAGALLLLVLAGCGGSEPAKVTGGTIKVGTLPIDAGAEAFYAKDKGFFERHGLKVDIQQFESGAAVAAAAQSGSIDVGFSNVVSLATATERGLPFRILAPAALYRSSAPTSVLMVAKDSPLRSARDLTGKVVAVDGLKNVTQVATQAWIDKTGGRSGAVKFLEVPFPEMGAALADHRVDAALIAEPALTAAKKDGARVLGNAYDALGETWLIGGWFTTSRWAEMNPDVARRFVQAMAETARFANRDHQASGRILTKYTKTPPKVVAAMTRAFYGDRVDIAMLRGPITAAARYGALDKPLDPGKLLVPSGAGQ
jgi:NitT/TauT family transport system substrate-binding protein